MFKGSALFALLFVPYVFACGASDSRLVDECVLNFNDPKACGCSVKKLKAALSSDDFGRYSHFLDLYWDQRQEASDGDPAEAWYQATRSYVRATGEESMRVEGDMVLLQSQHHRALQACGLDPSKPTERPQS